LQGRETEKRDGGLGKDIRPNGVLLKERTGEKEK